MIYNIDVAIDLLKHISKSGVKHFWSIDESIPADILQKLSSRIIEEGMTFHWHVRTRVDPGLLDECLAQQLEKAGLKHVLLGLESASCRILKLMKKTDNDDYLETLENIILTYGKHGICVHCPAIIGFPSEATYEREETFRFLDYLSQTYDNFSYNVNCFYLDIESDVAKHWTQYGIENISLSCAPTHYLGNEVDFICHPYTSKQTLCFEQAKQMIKQYSWYPQSAMVSPDVFYEMAEACSFPLIAPQNNTAEVTPLSPIDLSKSFKFKQSVGVFTANDGKHGLYDFEMHHCIVGYGFVERLINIASESLPISLFFRDLPEAVYDKAYEFISDLILCNIVQLIERR